MGSGKWKKIEKIEKLEKIQMSVIPDSTNSNATESAGNPESTYLVL